MPTTVFATVLLALLAMVPTGATAATPADDAHEPPRPLLWQVSDADNSIYLLGSFHLLKPDDYPVSADVDAAFADAERLVFELAPGQLADPGLQQRFLAAAGYDDARSLSEVLPARMSERLERLLEKNGGSLAQLEDYEPWFVNLSLMLGVSHSLGFSPEWGLDRRLMQRADKAGKPAGGLETMDDQLHALDAAPMDEQIVALADFLDRPQDMPGLLNELHQAWRQADIARLGELTWQEMRDKTPQTYRIVNVERNRDWLPQLQAMLDDSDGDDALVVVGAMHLLGDDGLVDMLRAHDYAVERICSACEPL